MAWKGLLYLRICGEAAPWECYCMGGVFGFFWDWMDGWRIGLRKHSIGTAGVSRVAWMRWSMVSGIIFLDLSRIKQI